LAVECPVATLYILKIRGSKYTKRTSSRR